MAAIHLLIVEDNDDDAVLVVHALRQGGVHVTYERVETAATAAAALANRPPDVVISDYSMPAFSAEEALRLLRETGQDVPFILVSGQIGEEPAAALMRAGAHDFLLKDRLTRLVPAVQRELREAEERRQRRQAEAALRESEERFRLLAEHAQDIIFRFRLVPEPEVEYISPAVSVITGNPPDELYGPPEKVFALVDPQDRARLEKSWWSPSPDPVVVRWHRPDGTPVWTEQRAVGLRDKPGRLLAVEGIMRDITDQVLAEQEQERLEQQLRQAERLDSLGQLAGGIAHDFNNLLGVIMGYADLVMSTLPSEDPRQADVLGIRHAAERGAALTRQLLIFSRLERSEPQALDLNAVVTDLERLLRRTIGEDIDLVSRLAPDLAPVLIDRSRFEQVVLNMVVNARAAMPEGGQLTITTTNVATPQLATPQLATPQVTAGEDDWPDGQTRGRYVRLTVVDTGCGMEPEVAERAFEPFFTTKGPGEGTGLGLATAYGAVKEAHGHIVLESEPGKGTTLHVYLPAGQGRRAVEPSPAPPPIRGAGETVLLVEDEEAVREIATRILRGHGYQVLAAISPVEALRLCGQPDVHIDVLLTDVVMPGLSGPQLVERVHQSRPGLPVLLMSGYATGSYPGGQVEPTGTPLIRKPFDGTTLLRGLREVLDHRPAITPGERGSF